MPPRATISVIGIMTKSWSVVRAEVNEANTRRIQSIHRLRTLVLSSSELIEHFGHLLVELLHGLARPDHYLEIDQPATVIEGQHVDAVDRDSFDVGLELEHGMRPLDHFADVVKAVVHQDVRGGAEVEFGHRRTLDRSVDDRRRERYVRSQEFRDTVDPTRLEQPTPRRETLRRRFHLCKPISSEARHEIALDSDTSRSALLPYGGGPHFTRACLRSLTATRHDRTILGVATAALTQGRPVTA